MKILTREHVTISRYLETITPEADIGIRIHVNGVRLVTTLATRPPMTYAIYY